MYMCVWMDRTLESILHTNMQKPCQRCNSLYILSTAIVVPRLMAVAVSQLGKQLLNAGANVCIRKANLVRRQFRHNRIDLVFANGEVLDLRRLTKFHVGHPFGSEE